MEKRGGRRPREGKEEEILHCSSYAWLRVESLEGVSCVFIVQWTINALEEREGEAELQGQIGEGKKFGW